MSKWELDEEFDKNPDLKIQATKDRWVKAKQDLEDAKYLEHLISMDFVRTIKSTLTAWDYRVPMIKLAQNETDKKKKKERENLSYIEHQIKEDFFKDEDRFNIKIHNIVSGGFEGYYWQLYFNVNKEEYVISIPHRENLTVKNIEYAYEGKFAFLHRTSECSWLIEFTDYTEEGMAKKLKEYFDKVLSE